MIIIKRITTRAIITTQLQRHIKAAAVTTPTLTEEEEAIRAIGKIFKVGPIDRIDLP